MESLRVITTDHIQQFVYSHDNQKSTERMMAECLPTGGLLSHMQRAQMMQMIVNMANLRSADTYVSTHPIVSKNSQFATSIAIVRDLECLITAKRHKIIELGGHEITQESAAYMRSYHFDRERFGRLSTERSFSSPALRAKWVRLSETVQVAKTRLDLLSRILDGVAELCSTMNMIDDYATVEETVRQGNKKAIKKFSELKV